jgi:prevent-host-death family protein
MKAVSVSEAKRGLARLLREVADGREIVVTRRGKPVATLAAYPKPKTTAERKAAIERAFTLLDQAPALGRARRFSRDEMHERSADCRNLAEAPSLGKTAGTAAEPRPSHES